MKWNAEEMLQSIKYSGSQKIRSYIPVPEEDYVPVETIDPLVNYYIEKLERTSDKISIEMELKFKINELEQTLKELNGFLQYVQFLKRPKSSGLTESVPSTPSDYVSD